MMFDPMYLLFLAPGLALSLWASFKTKSAFNKYSKGRVATGLTGAQAAQRMLTAAGISDVKIVPHQGTLSDHYNPVTKTLALSEPVFGVASIAAVGVACHEAGHAIQHARAYKPLWVRSLLVPTANIGSSVGYLVMTFGLMLGSMQFFTIGVALFSMVILFQLVTLPVEFDASFKRALPLLERGEFIPAKDMPAARAVLRAAAYTYVAALIRSILTIPVFGRGVRP